MVNTRLIMIPCTLALLLFFVPMLTTAATIRVPVDYTTIQAAITAASPGDTILVDSGTYRENVIVNRAITVLGNDTGSGLPVVDGNGGIYAIYIIANGVMLQGFNTTNASYGIYIKSSNNTLIGNIANSNNYGIYLTASSNNTLTGNTANDNTWHGIYLESNSKNNTVNGNVANNNTRDGISISGSSNNTLTGNTANNNKKYGISLAVSSNNNIVIGNTANNNNMYGVSIYRSNNNIVTGNTANNNQNYGIWLNGSYNSLTGNVANYNTIAGIDISGSSNNLLENIVSNNNNYGISFESSSSNNNLTGNTANNNTQYGIHFNSADNNSLSGNTLSNNKYGIYIYNSKNNIIWLNVIRGNINGNAYVYNVAANYWNSTSPILYTYYGQSYTNYTGNYWGDYNGPDTNYDGIGETPYTIFTNNTDYYPMLTLPPLAAGFAANVTSGVAPLTVQFNDTSIGSPASWNWSFGDGSPNETARNVSHTFLYAGTYDVALTVTNGTQSSTATARITAVFAGHVKNMRTGEVYPAIQPAIDAALSGDTILVDSGTYRENVNVHRALAVLGNDTGSGLPVVDGSGTGNAISISSNDATIRSFNIINATTGISITMYGNATLADNVVQNNTGMGISLIMSSGNTITGNIARNNSNGIWLLLSNNCTVTDNLARDNKGGFTSSGICVASSDNNILRNNEARNNTYAGIYVFSSSENNTIEGNAARYNNNGVLLDGSANNTVKNNTADNNPYRGIYLRNSGNNILKNNTALESHDNQDCYGIELENASDNALADNLAYNNSHGIYVKGAKNNAIANNTARDNQFSGIYLYASNDSAVLNNIARDNGNYGIWLRHSSNNNTVADTTAQGNMLNGIWLDEASNDNRIRNNTVSGSGNGILLFWHCEGNIVANNTAYDNDDGFSIFVSDYNTLSNNTAYNNGYYGGIRFYEANNTSVTGNTIRDNDNGTYLESSADNVFWLNNFSNNGGYIFEDSCYNRWNSTAPLSYTYYGQSYTNYTGNYWGDYNGPDANYDGIGDDPYVLADNNVDSYPMIAVEPALPVMQLNLTSYSVNENDGSVALRVSRAGYAAPAVSVDYNVTAGSALAGVNYQAPTPNPGTLNIPAFATYGEITVPILDDGLYGLPKTFNVALSSPSGATLGANTSATVTIVNQDPAPVLSFASPTYGVNEDAGNVTITVTLANPADTNTAVEYNTTDGTAKEGVNYVNTSGLLMFNHGVMSRTFTVPILDDGATTGNLTFNVLLTKAYSSPPGAAIGSPSETVVTIRDSEVPIIPVASFSSNVSSGAAPLTVQFNDTSSGYPDSWNWSFGDGSPNATARNVTHVFVSHGSYNVVLTVTNATNPGYASSYNVTIDVVEGATPTPTPTPTVTPTPSETPPPYCWVSLVLPLMAVGCVAAGAITAKKKKINK